MSKTDVRRRKPKTLQLHSMNGAIQTVTVPEMESEEYKLQKQADLLVLGLLQEKNKVSALLEACKAILTARKRKEPIGGMIFGEAFDMVEAAVEMANPIAIAAAESEA